MVVRTDDYAVTRHDWAILALHLLVEKKNSREVARMLLNKDNSDVVNNDSLAQKLRAVLTKQDTIGFSIRENEAPLVSFNAIKVVAFDLAQRGDNKNFSFVVPNYNNNTDVCDIYRGGHVFKTDSTAPIYDALCFNKAIMDGDHEKVAGILVTNSELTSNYSLARKFNRILTGQVTEITAEEYQDQSIPGHATLAMAHALMKIRD